MLAATREVARPAKVRQRTHAKGSQPWTKLVRVRTQESSEKPAGKAWRREGFFRWLDARIKEVDPPIRDMQHLADLCGDDLSHSALSNWRGGKYKPTLDKLAVLAGPLKVTKERVWAEAGMLPGTPADEAEDPAVAMIRASNLSDKVKAKLIETHQEEIQRERLARHQRLRETIELLSDQ